MQTFFRYANYPMGLVRYFMEKTMDAILHLICIFSLPCFTERGLVAERML